MKLTKSKLKEMIREVIKEDAPKGWEGTVKAMKKEKDIDNPWALAHWMKNKGYKSHKKESVKEAREINIDDLLKNSKVKEIMKRLGIRGSDTKSVIKVIQHFMRNPSALKAIKV